MVDKVINGKLFTVNPDEFVKVPHQEYTTLEILEFLGFYEKISGLLRDLKFQHKYLVCQGTTLGGWLPISLKDQFDSIYILQNNKTHLSNISKNIERWEIKNITVNQQECSDSYILFIDNNIDEKLVEHIRKRTPVVVSLNKLPNGLYNHCYTLPRKYDFAGDKEVYVYIPENLHSRFIEEFKYYIEEGNLLNYDNLIHLTIIVKNAGDSFEEILTRNLPIIDRWTILDTGSSDNTVDIINRVLVGKKKGELYQEPFINFRDSRNRCLDLAGDKCKYTLMMDDTYIIDGNLRDFLNTCRGDQFATSYSLYVKSNDSVYTSNRITKTENKLRYIYKIHEVIQTDSNVNVCIPLRKTWIYDFRCDYMENRTMSRKEYDLQLLFEEVSENPQDPRHLYYIAQTYNLLEKYELAFEYFLKRANHPVEGFVQEKIDALFEAARLANFKLEKPWETCEDLYMKSHELDKSRPESLYFIGIHHYLNGNYKTAYEYMVKSFEIGYPEHTQHSLKPTLSFHFLPKFLAELAYRFKNWDIGLKASKLFLQHNKKGDDSWDMMVSWDNIHTILNSMQPVSENPITPDIPYVCLIADGGFSKWTGKDIKDKGVGGSETYIIEMAKYIKLRGYRVVVFCNTDDYDVFDEVEYRPITESLNFFSKNVVRHCIVSRYSEYIPLAIEGHVENIHLILHDLCASGTVIPIHSKIKNIYCLTQWHCDHFRELYPEFENIIKPFYYGVDIDTINSFIKPHSKIPHKFIYSSTANRGLLILLELWPRILEKWPNASLSILCDLENKWVNDFATEQIVRIKEYLKVYTNHNIKLLGWSSKETLYKEWSTASIWFYPCIFSETFCLTALEAAVSKTLVITNDLAGLKETVGERGVVISGNAATQEWKENALIRLFEVVDNDSLSNNYIDANYNWVKNMSWKSRANYMVDNYFKDKEIETVRVEEEVSEIKTVEDVKDKILSNLMIYYNFRNSGNPKTNVLTVGNDCSYLDLPCKIINSDISAISDLRNLISETTKYGLIYLNYDDVSYIDYYISWKNLIDGGFLITRSLNSKFIKEFDSSLNMLNSEGLIILEKIN